MNGQYRLFLILIILNFVIVLIYLIWSYLRQKEKKGSIWVKAWTMFLCPIVAPAFIGLSYLSWCLLSQKLDVSDIIFSKDKEEEILYPDEDTEKNMISLEEALTVTDKRNLRTVMMNVLRGDYYSSLSSISLALNSEDSETSHYAASILQDVLNNFRVDVQNRYAECLKENEQTVQNCTELIEYMNPVLVQGVFTDIEQKSMVMKLDEVCEIAWNYGKEEISSSCYEMVILRLLEIEEFEECRKWCERAMEQYPRTLASYTCQLKLYFSCGEKEHFFDVMERLKHSDIAIDNETLELIRTFM